MRQALITISRFHREVVTFGIVMGGCLIASASA